MGNVNLLENIDDAFELRRWLGERRPILCLDTETGGLNPYRDQLRLVQFGDTESAWAVPAQDWRGFIRDCVRDYQGEISLHNATFDAHYFREQVGVELPWERVHDTEIQSHVLFPPGRHGLKYLATQKVHPGAGAGEVALHEAMHRGKWTWATVPVNLKEYWVYGAVDTIIDAQLHVIQHAEIEQRGLTRIYELERQVQPVLYAMERHGAAVDLDYCREKSVAMFAYCEQVKEWAKSAYGVDNLASNRQLARALLNDGVPLDVKTAKGDYSVTEAVLKRFIEHPLAASVLNLRKYTKIRSSYFDNFLAYATNGVVHPNIRQVGARTGRMSVTDPALQTLPRGTEVRDAFVARPGWKLVSIDFEQIEARIFAALSEDPSLIQAIADYDAGIGPDLHTYCARVVYGDQTIQKKDKRRDLAKNTTFCTMFGGGAAKIATTAGVPLAEAERFLHTYLEVFPGVRRFQRETDRLGRATEAEDGVAYIHTVYGRYLPLVQNEGYYKLTNYRIQGSAADIFKDRLVSVANAGFLDYLVMAVHDEIILEMPEEWAEAAIPHIKAAMEEPYALSVPILANASKPEDRWGACK